MTLLEAFRENRDKRSNQAAFLIAAGDRSVPIPWRKFARDVETVAHLAQKHLPRGTVGLLGENSYEWMVAHAAALLAGLVVVPLETNLSAAEIAEYLSFAGAQALLYSSLYAEKAREVMHLKPDLKGAGFGSRQIDLAMEEARRQLDAGAKSIFDLPMRDENEPAMIVFTSGTTSKPRGAVLTLAALTTTMAFADTCLPVCAEDRTLMLLPLHHIYGMAITYFMLVKGVALGVCPDFRRFYDAVVRFRANVLYLVPALVEILATKIDRLGNNASEVLGTQLKWVLSGGAPLSRRTHEHMAGLGVKMLQIYGLTETCALYAMSPYSDPRPGSVGKSCAGFGGMETKVSKMGQLLIRGPATLRRYFKEPDLTVHAFSEEGWFNTGDTGTIDADGYVWLTGRISRTILLSSGKKIAPEELEEKILSLEGVREVVVSGNTSSRELTAEVFADISEKELRGKIAALNRNLAVYKRIRNIVMRNKPFPRTDSGKIRFEEVVGKAQVPHHVTKERPSYGWLIWAAGFAALVVLVVNIARIWVERTGLAAFTIPVWVFDMFEEGGEAFLALIVLTLVVVVSRNFGRHRE